MIDELGLDTDEPSSTRTMPFDPVHYLDTEDARIAFLREAIDADDLSFIKDAVKLVDRSIEFWTDPIAAQKTLDTCAPREEASVGGTHHETGYTAPSSRAPEEDTL